MSKVVIVANAKIKEDNIIIRIIDNGSGATKEVRERMFEPFYSGKDNLSGLGLTITQKIIEGHNGIIKVEPSSSKGVEVKIILNRYKEDINV